MKKRIMLFLAIVCFISAAVAQRKSIAILETYCAEGNISNAYLMMIGSNIETGIIKNPSYTAYNRAQVRALMSEHKFERSGLVKDEDIRELGKMAGVDYVLASEAALLENQVFVTAKVLNVVSGRYEMSDNELMDYNPSAIQRGCQNLAAKLLGGGSTPKEIRPTSTNPVSNSDYQATNISGRNVGLPQPNKDIVIKEGLLAYWNFDNGNSNDATDNGYDANLIGNPKFINETPNGYGKALLLQAAKKQYMVVPYNLIPATFTMCFWVKDFGGGLLFAEPKGRGLGVSIENRIVFLGRSYGSLKLLMFDYNSIDIQSSGWHHIAIVVRSSNRYGDTVFQLFIDGKKVDEQTGNYIYESSKFQFGGAIEGAGSTSFKVDNIRIYSRLLNVNEIKQIYNSEKTSENKTITPRISK
ncbi:MAG: hypothetical protein J6Q96_01955 [Bacteroidales bacterium]|nr:hypothetical protein [Bacteroidales bacterium]